MMNQTKRDAKREGMKQGEKKREDRRELKEERRKNGIVRRREEGEEKGYKEKLTVSVSLLLKCMNTYAAAAPLTAESRRAAMNAPNPRPIVELT